MECRLLGALNANMTVSRDTLVDEIWGDAAPGSAPKMVQIHVSQLRKVLPEGVLRTRPSGYSLELDAGDAAAAAELLREALALWRGPALAVISEPFAPVEAARLEELRVAALEDRIEADLGLGRGADLVAELDRLVARHPLRERLRGQQMRALYRAGRQADALAAYRSAERMLREELGIHPSAELRELGRRVLAQEDDLGPPLVKAANWLTHLQRELDSPVWRHWIHELGRRSTLIRYDDRGCGLSDRDPPDHSLEARVADLEAVVDAARLERFPLLGVSGGGAVAIEYAARHPERISRLVLYGAYARGRARRGPTAAAEAELMIGLVQTGWGRGVPAFRRVFPTCSSRTRRRTRWTGSTSSSA
jgi:DNA-binding SARP family transcriptional activator